NEQWEQKQTAYRFRYALKVQYTTLCKKCQTTVFSKKALDKQGVLTYNRDRKSTPVDGLLPLFQLKRNNRHKFCSSGAVISFSSCDHGCHVFYTMKR
ncbi:hypothetical protein, partial [Ruminococcus callidus]